MSLLALLLAAALCGADAQVPEPVQPVRDPYAGSQYLIEGSNNDVELRTSRQP